MRRRRTDLRARVNRDLPLEFDDVTLTSYAGLELFARYVRRVDFNRQVRQAWAGGPRWGDFGVVTMVRLVVGLVIVGGRRLRHLAYVADDPVFQRFAGVRVVPTARTLSRWLTHFTMPTVRRLQALNAAVVGHLLPGLGLRTWTIDVDGVVVSTGLQVERAFRGFNPHHRKVPSYYPIMAHLAETTHILRVKNRSGNVHDGKAGLPFLRALWPQLAALRTGGARLRFRMDGAFFRQDVLRWLQARRVGYAIKVPFYRWLDLQQYIRAEPVWVPVAPNVTGVTVPHAATPWQIPVAVTIYRKKVAHRATKNYQLDLFDPNDGHYEYSAVTSNLGLTVRNLWFFACGRGNHEKTIAQLKSGLAFHSVSCAPGFPWTLDCERVLAGGVSKWGSQIKVRRRRREPGGRPEMLPGTAVGDGFRPGASARRCCVCCAARILSPCRGSWGSRRRGPRSGGISFWPQARPA